MTIADLEEMPDDGNRYELIEGKLYVSCTPGLTHQIVSDNIVHLIRSYLDRNPIGTIVSTIGLILSDYDGLFPTSYSSDTKTSIVWFLTNDYMPLRI